MPRGTSPEIKAKQAEALRLRSLGWNLTDIAAAVGYADGSGASKAIEAAYVRTIREPAEIVRQMELDRLDIMLKKALGIMEAVHVFVSQGHVVREYVLDAAGRRITIGMDAQGNELYEMRTIIDHAPSLKAIDTCLRIMERRAKLLGLDAPTKVEVFTLDYIEAKIRELADELGEDVSALLARTEDTADQE